MSNLSGEEGSFSAGEEVQKQNNNNNDLHASNATTSNNSNGSQRPTVKKKRNLPGNPDPTAEVVALSPDTLMASNRFVCEICNKGFQRDQNLQLHRRGHNLPWKLKQRTSNEVKKKVYICPVASCVHHNPARALGDLTGIKKHYSRKHGEKKWKCDRCSKKYAVQSDWKAHQKTCGTREYKCDCGTIFSRRDSFITHRAFCDALAEENSKANNEALIMNIHTHHHQDDHHHLISSSPPTEFNNHSLKMLPTTHQQLLPIPFDPIHIVGTGIFSTSSSGTLFGSTPRSIPPTAAATSSSGLQLSSNNASSPFGYFHEHNTASINGLMSGGQMSATALLQKAAQMGASVSSSGSGAGLIVGGMVGPDHSHFSGPIQQMRYGLVDHHHQPGLAGIDHQHSGKNLQQMNGVSSLEEGNGAGSAVHEMNLYL